MTSAKIPHFPISREPVHFGYRLFGSVPKKIERELMGRRDHQLAMAKEEARKMPPQLAGQFLQLKQFEINAKYELAIDDYLHEGSNGPYHLANPKLATIVLDSLKFLHENGDIYLFAACVMSNHVHAVFGVPEEKEEVDPGQLMKRHKSFTSGECNKVLGRTGNPFWNPTYFDRTIRKGKFMRVMWYVLNNPVKAGLVNNWREWPFAWVNPEYASLFTPV